jgi:hypothetical protein
VGVRQHEVIAPDMISMLRAQPDAGAVIQPQSAAFRLSFWHFETFLTPESLDPFVIHVPTLAT